MPARYATLRAKIAYRAYLGSMRFEAMVWIGVRRRLLDIILGRRHRALNIFPNVFIEDCHGLTLGDDVSINRGCNLSCGGGLEIGDYVAIGHGASILSSEHGFDDPATPIKYQPVVRRPTRIGSNVWIGAKATILAGVSIADGTVVAAGAVVTRSVEEPDTIVGGIPARRLKSRLSGV